MKKILLLVLSMAILVCAVPHVAFASNTKINVNGLTYELTSDWANKTAVLKSGNNASGVVVIPDTVSYGENHYRVTAIGTSAFRNCKSLTGVLIPFSVESIDADAFSGCSSLMMVYTSNEINNNMQTIGEWAFSNCSSLTSIDIPNTVTTIGEWAFSNCSGLTSINIPSNVTTIADGTFNKCSSLVSINVASNNPNLESRDGVLFSNGGKELVAYPGGKTGNYIIPNSVIKIRGDAFRNCSGLTSVTIAGNGLTTIGEGAFSDCSSLTSIDIPNTVTTIDEWAFSNCGSLTSIDIPNTVTTIGGGTFSNCSSLTSIDIPNTVTTIGEGAFSCCESLRSIKIPDSVVTIGEEAFWKCESLESAGIGKGVKFIGDNAFMFCSSLTSINVASGNSNLESKYGVLFSSGGKELVVYPGGKTGSYTVPNSVESIGKSAFNRCSKLTSVTIGKCVTTMVEESFCGCSSLTSINVDPENPKFKSKDGVLFSKDCTKLVLCPQGKTGDYTIPGGVNTIGDWAFSCCRLTSITIGSSVTYIFDGAFGGCSRLESINVVPDNLNFKVEDGVLFNIAGTSLILCSKGKTGNYTIPNSVTTISDYAFFGCRSLTSITIGSNVDYISEGAFENCDSLTSITIPRNFDKYIFDNDDTGISVCDNNTFTNSEGKSGSFVLV